MSAQQSTEATRLLVEKAKSPLAKEVSINMPEQPLAKREAPAAIPAIEGLRTMCCMIILSIHYQDKVAQNRRMPDAFSSQVERFFFAVLPRMPTLLLTYTSSFPDL